ncbi:MAG: hypothetical protein FLDDKLPJ_02615 [Phycisphaerae bacterium]|nr:hypothetical protein [Phycisphaerae bacterium]
MVVFFEVLALLMATPHASSQDQSRTQPESPTPMRDDAGPPTAESIIEAMAKRRAGGETVLPRGRKIADGSAQPDLLVEGTPIIDRAGRLIEVGGRWTFIFDGSAEEPPIELLPNLVLERMIYQAAVDQDDTVFVVQHGEITEFQGRNYLLVRTVTARMPDRNLSK